MAKEAENDTVLYAHKELAFQYEEKGKRAAELAIANKELAFQNKEKGKRAAELIIANKELIFQNREKEKRAAELIIANKELIFQNKEKEKRAAELVIANKELHYQNEEKEKRAAELIIANKELIKAEKERTKIIADIVQRNNDLEQFSYIVSHNLRAPVANILGLVDVIRTIGIDASEEKQITRYLEIAAKNLDNVIIDMNNVLELKHNLIEKRKRIKFEEILKQIELRFDNTLNDEKLTIISDFSEIEEMTTINSCLYSIFYNLISNSLKYRRSGVAPVIEITSHKVNNKIRLRFKDNGLGIDMKKNAAGLFGLYKRFHFHVEGKGLGLFMVKAQVEALGGKIKLLSEVNKGCEFRIEFDER